MWYSLSVVIIRLPTSKENLSMADNLSRADFLSRASGEKLSNWIISFFWQNLCIVCIMKKINWGECLQYLQQQLQQQIFYCLQIEVLQWNNKKINFKYRQLVWSWGYQVSPYRNNNSPYYLPYNSSDVSLENLVYDQPVILLIFYCFCKEEADLIDDEVLLHKTESRISIYDSLLWQERMHSGLSGNENAGHRSTVCSLLLCL